MCFALRIPCSVFREFVTTRYEVITQHGTRNAPPEHSLPARAEFAISFGLMKFCVLFAVALIAVAAMLEGCSKKSHGHALPQPPRVATCSPGISGGRLVLAAGGNPRTFNPLLAVEPGSDSVVRLLFSSLVTMNFQSQEAEPGLAESWSVAPDQKTWTFKLRKNLRWSDGEPLTADDVVFTWNDIIYNPKYNQLTYDLFRSKGINFQVTKVDDLTVRVVTPEIFAPFLEYFGSVIVILPRHTLGRWVASGDFPKAYAVTDKPENIVGSGPFRLKSFASQRSVLLERNPEYWTVDKQGQRLPYFDEVELLIPPAQGASQNLFLDGTTAVCENIPLEDIWAFQQAATNRHFQIVDLGVGVQRDFLWFNQNTGAGRDGKPYVEPYKLKWFRDKRFRQAISRAIDRDRIVHDVYNGHAQVVYGFLSADNKKWNDSTIPEYSYDPEKAHALLTELGMTRRPADGMLVDATGHQVEFTLIASFGNPVRAGIAARVTDDLKQLGIQMKYAPVDFPTLLRRINGTMDYESASMGFGGGGLDPASQMNVLKSEASLHQWFPMQRQPSTDWEKRIDALMDHQMHTLDFSQRKKDFDEVQAIWADEIPMVCIAAPTTSAAVRSNIGNLRPAIASGYHATWNIEELYFTK
jgi:peptide/nickel transport system substrate-binding protein